MLASGGHAQTIDAEPVRLDGQTVVTTGFSGTLLYQPKDSGLADESADELRFIDLEGASATLTHLNHLGRGADAQELDRRPYGVLRAGDIGQVFGIAIDDAPQPNLYLTASSAYGLYLVGGDENADGLPDRMLRGGPEAQWMEGLFGADPKAGPGTVWRINGATGAVEIFANITLDGTPNSGPALGNIAYDPRHRQLFVSDLDTGMIHRLDLSGRDLEQFDHGVTGRAAAGLSPQPFDPENRLDPQRDRFDTLAPETWAFAQPERRVWGLAPHDGRLFYALAQGGSGRTEIWSVGLNPQTGAFETDPRWELTLPGALPDLEVSDIGFTAAGVMLLAQRGERKASFDYSGLAGVGEASVLRFVAKDPENKPQNDDGSDWLHSLDAYATGFAADGRGATGGLALGPGYDAQGTLDMRACHGTLWSTGEALRNSAEHASALRPGGKLDLDGVQAQPIGLLFGDNSPPWISYFHDFDGVPPEDQARSGHMGDVEVLGCLGGGTAVPAPEVYLSTLKPAAPGNSGPGSPGGSGTPTPPLPCTSPSCLAVLCLVSPSLCLPDTPPQSSCAAPVSEVKCDPETGTYVLDLTLGLPASPALDRVKLSDASGVVTALPQEQATSAPQPIDLTGMAPGQALTLDICAFDAASRDTGNPYPCCNTTVRFRMPVEACQQEVEQ